MCIRDSPFTERNRKKVYFRPAFFTASFHLKEGPKLRLAFVTDLMHGQFRGTIPHYRKRNSVPFSGTVPPRGVTCGFTPVSYTHLDVYKRQRLDKLIQKIELSDKNEEEPFSTFIKGLAVDSRIDLETAKLIIDKYKQEKGK